MLLAVDGPVVDVGERPDACFVIRVTGTGELDVATRHVLAAFQMHYRPALHDGQPDAETAAIMLAMQ